MVDRSDQTLELVALGFQLDQQLLGLLGRLLALLHEHAGADPLLELGDPLLQVGAPIECFPDCCHGMSIAHYKYPYKAPGSFGWVTALPQSRKRRTTGDTEGPCGLRIHMPATRPWTGV